LKKLVAEHGTASWAKIATLIGTRSDVQCRYRFRKIEKAGNALFEGNDSESAEPSPPVGPISLSPSTFNWPGAWMEKSLRSFIKISPAPKPMPQTRGGEILEDSLLRYAPLAPFGTCGTDPKSLSVFLDHFA
jgi:hypothetical protein